jgi:hypothetical protein
MTIMTIQCAPGYRMSGSSVVFTDQHAAAAARKGRTWLLGNGAAPAVIIDVQSLSASSDERSP